MPGTIIGVMGPGSGATAGDLLAAEELGRLIAKENWVLLTGGRASGVMEAASKGAKEAGGLTIGILPTFDKTGMSEFVDIPVVTGMGSARNNINVLTPDVVVACGVGMGTMSEVMLAVKAGKKVILLNQTDASKIFLNEFQTDSIIFASSPIEAVDIIKETRR